MDREAWYAEVCGIAKRPTWLSDWTELTTSYIYKTEAVQFSSVWSLSRVQFFVTQWTAACQTFLSINNFWSLLKLMSIDLVLPSNHLVLCHPLLLLPLIFPSIRVFSKESVLHIKWPKYWSFSFSISPSSEYSGLISFRIDWFNLFVVQGTLKSLLQHHSSKASILQRSAFFILQLSHPYVTTGKTIALIRQTFVGKVMSLIFNMLSCRWKWQITPVFLPGESHRRRSLIGYSPRGCKELDTTERLHLT